MKFHDFFKVMDDVKAGIQYIFQTKNKMTLALSSTGHAGMECVMTNLIEKNDVVLIANHGIWGERAMDMARRQGKRSRKSQLDLFAFLFREPKESRKALTKFLYEATTTTLKKFLPSFSLLAFFIGGDVRELAKPAGEVFTLEEIGRALETHKPVLFFVTHAESSTGGLQGLEGIGPLCAR